MEPGEPSGGCYRMGRTTWWVFTAPVTEWVALDAQGGSYDTVINVYKAAGPGLTGLARCGIPGMGNLAPGLGVALLSRH